jgi:hypothetical protein
LFNYTFHWNSLHQMEGNTLFFQSISKQLPNLVMLD